MSKIMCQFPGCRTELTRSKIHFHHITPREVDKSRKNRITVPLCPTCHSLIFHPKSTSGNHSIKVNESIEILGMFPSTFGEVMHFKKCSDNSTHFYFTKNGDIIED